MLVLGTTIRGSTRWITLPGFQFQPSELGKLTVILALAAFIADRRDRMGSVRVSMLALGYIAIPAALVFLEPDLGTSLVYAAAGLAALLISGVPFRHFAALAAVVLAVGAAGLRGAAGGRDARAQAVPDRPSHVVPASRTATRRATATTSTSR